MYTHKHTLITHNKYTIAKNRTTAASISINNINILITVITKTPFNKYLKTTGAITSISKPSLTKLP